MIFLYARIRSTWREQENELRNHRAGAKRDVEGRLVIMTLEVEN
jgi:hypothetical protein